MRKTVLYLFILVLLGCQGAKKEPLQEPFSSYLDYGDYSVGFKTLFKADISRENVPFSDWSGRLYPSSDTSPGRKLPLHIWYPTDEKAPLLPFSHFVDLITPQTEAEKGVHSDSLSREIYRYQADELKGEKGMTDRELDTLLQLTTFSSLETKVAPGHFPLVIVPNGSSPANQSTLCEYLASHGYIVAGVSLKGEFAHVVDASARGLESGVDDLQFALWQLLQLPNVDTGQIALVGNAIESSYCAALASRNKKIKALVSLEGGFLSQYEQRILNETVFYEPQSVSLPILAIYAPHPNISPDNIYGLDFSNRYFARLPEMSEFHFLNYGLLDAYVPNIIGEPRGDLEAGFTAGAKLILAFLDANLKNKDESFQQYYGRTPSDKLGKSVDTLYVLEGHEPPPNMSLLKNLFVTQGFAAIDSIYHAHVSAGNSKPFSQTFYNDYKNWLAYRKDPQYIYRRGLYEMAVESYPNSALNHYRLAYYLEQNRQPIKAQEHYLEANILLPLDKSLNPSLRLDLQQALDEVLK